MATINTQYLQFNAYSIKEMIIRKLSEDTKFTDQVYEGSNLNILIDLVSYMYQCLVYNLNNSAAESMFADTQIYENMNRLVKFLGYNPKGIIPSNGSFYIDNTDAQYTDQYILKYSTINTGIVDDRGEQVYYSTMDDIHIDSSGENQTFKFKMYNGLWKLYPTVFTATGSDYEQFDLPNIASDTENAKNSNSLVANGGIHVYVEHKTINSNGTYSSTITQYSVVDQELFVNTNFNENITSYARIYTRYDTIVNARMNADKTYSIKFGNGILGKKLQPGDQVYVMYFATNGNQAELSYDNFTSAKKLVHNASMFGITPDVYNKIFGNGEYSIASNGNDQEIDVYLVGSTTKSIEEESVDDIRSAAPEWFKIGQRLITSNDYVYYVKNLRKGEVVDVVCQNNYEYAATFYKWLYDLGIKNHSDTTAERYYLNRNVIAKYNCTWADPVDVNNVYLWTKMSDNASISTLKQQYVEDMQKIKCMTSNIIFLDAIDVNFSVTAMPKEVIKQLLLDGSYSENYDSYIEVTMDNNVLYASSVVAEQIDTIIHDFFNSDTIKIGGVVNYNELMEKIYSINGIQRIRTVYLPDNDITRQKTYEGISFATWSADIVDIGDDLQISNSMRSLEQFQYPIFFDTTLQKRIKVIKKSINSGIRIQY